MCRKLLGRAASKLARCIVLICTLIAQTSPADAAPNAQSALGMNLGAVGVSSSEMPFLDNFKSNSGWITHSNSTWDTNEEKYIDFDANGWPKSLRSVGSASPQQFTSLVVLLLRNLPTTSNGVYPSGQYVVLYDGEGTLSYDFDAVKIAAKSTPGRDVINVATPTEGGGIALSILTSDPKSNGNYIRNIRVVKAEQEALFRSGSVFNPAFLSLAQRFRVLRFMDWLATNGSVLSSWSTRPHVSDASWSTAKGVPIEVAMQLVNALSADAWLNIPHQANDDYIKQFATLVHSFLGNNQRVYLEVSNEVWNGSFAQYQFAAAQGRALFASGLGSDYEYNRSWYGMRTAQACDIWKAAWASDANRITCVLGAQAANTYSAIASLNCTGWTSGKPCARHGIDAVAIAPYFGGNVPTSWTSQSDGGLGQLFGSIGAKNDSSVPIGGWMGQLFGWIDVYPAALAPFKLPLIAYEGGQSFVAFPNGANSSITNLYIAANRDPRMGLAYTNLLQHWKAIGGQLFMPYSDVGASTQYGEWGALESTMQSVTPLQAAPPKWKALQDFISGNPCWWDNCSAPSPGSIPNVPTNVKVK